MAPREHLSQNSHFYRRRIQLQLYALHGDSVKRQTIKQRAGIEPHSAQPPSAGQPQRAAPRPSFPGLELHPAASPSRSGTPRASRQPLPDVEEETHLLSFKKEIKGSKTSSHLSPGGLANALKYSPACNCMKMINPPPSRRCHPGAFAPALPITDAVPPAWLRVEPVFRLLRAVKISGSSLPTYLKYLMNIWNGHQRLVCLLKNKGENIWVICSLFCKTIMKHLVTSPGKGMKAEGIFYRTWKRTRDGVLLSSMCLNTRSLLAQLEERYLLYSL